MMKLFGEVKDVCEKYECHVESKGLDINEETVEVKSQPADFNGFSSTLPDEMEISAGESSEFEFKEEIRRLKVDVAEMFRLVKSLSDSQTELKLRFQKQEQTWLEEKNEMKKQIQKLEEKLLMSDGGGELSEGEDLNMCRPRPDETRLEVVETKVKCLEENERESRRKRRRNVIITNLDVDQDKASLEEVANSLLANSLQVSVKVEKARVLAKNKFGESIVQVKLQNIKDKLEIMKNKFKLQNNEKRIYISDDLTASERRIQREITSRVREERRKGKDCKVGYQKICIDGIWEVWEKFKKKQ